MENNTNTVNNKNKYIVGGIIAAVLIVAIILVVVFMGNNETPVVDEYLEDEVHYVSPHLYAASILEGTGVVDKAAYLYDLYRSNEVTKSYKNYIGREFLNSLTVADVNGKDIEIKSGNKKILIFTEGDKDYYDYYEGYLYLGALAKDVGAYDLYVIDTNENTMGDFSDNFNAHLLNKPTPEVIEFLKPYPTDFILFVNENNLIECITDLMHVNEVSRGGGYVFSTYYASQEYIRLFEEYEKDPAAATEAYYNNTMYDSGAPTEYDSTAEVNSIFGTNFYRTEDGKLLNESVLVKTSKIYCYDGKYIETDFENSNGRIFSIQQGIGFNSLYLNAEDFDYYSSITIDDMTTIYLYGKNQDEITNFLFSKNNVKVHICSDEGWNKKEVELIVNNF